MPILPGSFDAGKFVKVSQAIMKQNSCKKVRNRQKTMNSPGFEMPWQLFASRSSVYNP